jgi:hypothetical protein
MCRPRNAGARWTLDGVLTGFVLVCNGDYGCFCAGWSGGGRVEGNAKEKVTGRRQRKSGGVGGGEGGAERVIACGSWA